MQTIAAKYKTPCYIYNQDKLLANLADYLKFVEHPHNIVYPVKTNPAHYILNTLATYGCCADCASLHEINLACINGFPIDHIYYNTQIPDMQIMIHLLQHGGHIVIDSSEIMTELNGKLQDMKYTGSILLRVCPKPGTISTYLNQYEHQEDMGHCRSDSKFGIPFESIKELIVKCTNLHVTGFHIHVGTMMDNLMPYADAITMMHQLVDVVEELEELGHVRRITEIDLGGGLGISLDGVQPYPAIDQYAKLLSFLKRPELNYLVEPGNSLVGNTTQLLTTVKAFKNLRGKKWAICDVGTDQLIEVTLMKLLHQVTDINQQPLLMTGNDSLGGPLCFAGDVILPHTNLDNVKLGDLLLINNVGSYCYSTSSNFNGYLNPCHVTPKGDLLISRQDFTNHLMFDCNQNTPSNIDFLHHVAPLQSKYLSTELTDDVYRVISAEHNDDCTRFKYRVQVSSSLGSISAPLGLRIVGDLSIVSILKSSGYTEKNVSVVGSQLYMMIPVEISIEQPITVTIHLQPLYSSRDRNRRWAMCQINDVIKCGIHLIIK